MSSSGCLSPKDIQNRINGSRNLSDIVLDANDYEMNSQTVFNDSHYFSIDSLNFNLANNEKLFTFFDLNIQSLSSKYDSLIATLDCFKNQNIDISSITIQETWLGEVGPDLHIPGY